jgi:PEP-CTERM motif
MNFLPMNRLLAFSALILGCLLPVASYADPITLQFENVGGASNGTDYIYPYYFSVNGSSPTVAMMCASFDDHITFGESWTATLETITTASSVAQQEDAYLYTQLGNPNYSVEDVQEAVWYLSDSTPGTVPLTANDPTLLTDALAAVTAADLGGSQSFDNGEVALLVPIAGSQTPGNGTPQSFLVDPTIVATPEPGSLLLTGTGLLGSALTILRRRRVIA